MLPHPSRPSVWRVAEPGRFLRSTAEPLLLGFDMTWHTSRSRTTPRAPGVDVRRLGLLLTFWVGWPCPTLACRLACDHGPHIPALAISGALFHTCTSSPPFTPLDPNADTVPSLAPQLPFPSLRACIGSAPYRAGMSSFACLSLSPNAVPFRRATYSGPCGLKRLPSFIRTELTTRNQHLQPLSGSFSHHVATKGSNAVQLTHMGCQGRPMEVIITQISPWPAPCAAHLSQSHQAPSVPSDVQAMISLFQPLFTAQLPGSKFRIFTQPGYADICSDTIEVVLRDAEQRDGLISLSITLLMPVLKKVPKCGDYNPANVVDGSPAVVPDPGTGQVCYSVSTLPPTPRIPPHPAPFYSHTCPQPTPSLTLPLHLSAQIPRELEHDGVLRIVSDSFTDRNAPSSCLVLADIGQSLAADGSPSHMEVLNHFEFNYTTATKGLHKPPGVPATQAACTMSWHPSHTHASAGGTHPGPGSHSLVARNPDSPPRPQCTLVLNPAPTAGATYGYSATQSTALFVVPNTMTSAAWLITHSLNSDVPGVYTIGEYTIKLTKASGGHKLPEANLVVCKIASIGAYVRQCANHRLLPHYASQAHNPEHLSPNDMQAVLNVINDTLGEPAYPLPHEGPARMTSTCGMPVVSLPSLACPRTLGHCTYRTRTPPPHWPATAAWTRSPALGCVCRVLSGLPPRAAQELSLQQPPPRHCFTLSPRVRATRSLHLRPDGAHHHGGRPPGQEHCQPPPAHPNPAHRPRQPRAARGGAEHCLRPQHRPADARESLLVPHQWGPGVHADAQACGWLAASRQAPAAAGGRPAAYQEGPRLIMGHPARVHQRLKSHGAVPCSPAAQLSVQPRSASAQTTFQACTWHVLLLCMWLPAQGYFSIPR